MSIFHTSTVCSVQCAYWHQFKRCMEKRRKCTVCGFKTTLLESIWCALCTVQLASSRSNVRQTSANNSAVSYSCCWCCCCWYYCWCCCRTMMTINTANNMRQRHQQSVFALSIQLLSIVPTHACIHFFPSDFLIAVQMWFFAISTVDHVVLCIQQSLLGAVVLFFFIANRHYHRWLALI